MPLPPSPPPRRGRRLRRGPVGLLVLVVLSLVATACLPPLVDPPTSGKSFGQGPLEAVYDAATAQATCGLTAVQLAAMMMAPTYSEAGGPVPSPMTLSRYDNVSVNSTNANLFAFGQTTGPYVNAFFSPGIGMWQFDSAGGWPFSAAGAIDSVTAANQAATTISYRWCNAPTSQQVDAPTRRKYAWGPWFGCSTTSVCESVYTSLLVGDALNTAFDASVTRYGGMQQRTCNVAGLGDGLTCWYVNPSLAQGSKGWTGGTYAGSTTGVTPLPKPFYVVESGGKEFRVWISADTGYDIGITASKPITANARTAVVWQRTATLCDVTAGRGACTGRIAQTPSGPRMADPFGSLDSVVPSPDRRITASGWAIDPDTNDPLDVHVYIDGAFATVVRADQSRPDVAAVVPGYGDAHGYSAVVAGVTPGVHQVCTYAINAGPYGTTNPQLGCASVTVPGDPFGSMESAVATPGGARVVGWAIDPDTTAPVAVHVYVDGQWAGATSAAVARPDVATVYPWAGAGHGYDVTLPTAGGSHQVCTYAINTGATGTQNPRLGCATVVVDGSPLGSFDAAVATAGGVEVGGWAFDPDTRTRPSWSVSTEAPRSRSTPASLARMSGPSSPVGATTTGSTRWSPPSRAPTRCA